MPNSIFVPCTKAAEINMYMPSFCFSFLSTFQYLYLGLNISIAAMNIKEVIINSTVTPKPEPINVPAKHATYITPCRHSACYRSHKYS